MRMPGFIGPSYTLRSVNFDCQRCVNLYPEMDELGTGKEREVAMLVGTPGLSLLVTLPTSPVRGVYVSSKGLMYVVSGNTLYEVSSIGVYTSRGTVNTSFGPVSMADNGLQLCVVTGNAGYILTLATNAFAQITDPDFVGANVVAFLDGYFVFNKPGTGQFYISALYDGSAIDALDFASAEGLPDPIVSVLNDHRELWLFGSQSVEVWYNTGASDFPFDRIQGAFIEHGCAAAYSPAKLDNTVFWLGQDDRGSGVVWKAQGYMPQRISTHAVERAIQSYATISDAVAYTYQEEGHAFYVLNFTSANTTWVYDVTTGLWHERAYLDNGVLTRHLGNYSTFIGGKHIVSDYRNGNLYVMDLDYTTDNGTAITRLRTAPHVTQDLDRLFFSRFQLDLETGVGLDGVGQGTDPQATLQWSDDGGHTWSNELMTPIGKIGQYKARAVWRRLGQSRDRVFRVKITEPVKCAILGANLDVVAGTT